MAEKEPKKLGRPRKEFSKETEEKVAEAALLGCQNATIAGLVEMDVGTMVNHYSSLLQKKRKQRKYELRLKQWNLAENNVAMAIFLGKNELEQRDRHELTGKLTLADVFLAADQESELAGAIKNLDKTGDGKENED